MERKCEFKESVGKYVVFEKVPMNNLPGCGMFFWQEIYRSSIKTKKLKALMKETE